MTTALATDNRGRIEWIPPRTRQEADQEIDRLLNDIGIIQAQLAETREAWCERTGLTFEEHAAWRRRAIFAKTFKEGQLRQCKRLRQSWLQVTPGLHADGTLLDLANAVVVSWDEHMVDGGVQAVQALEAAIGALRRHLAIVAEGTPGVASATY